jgi:hypothetical protein
MAEQILINQWADLLSALIAGAAAVTTSPEEMANDMPAELVEPVNAELQRRGYRSLVGAQARRRASACRAACSSNSRRRSSSV